MEDLSKFKVLFYVSLFLIKLLIKGIMHLRTKQHKKLIHATTSKKRNIIFFLIFFLQISSNEKGQHYKVNEQKNEIVVLFSRQTINNLISTCSMNDKPCFLVNNRRPFIVSLTFWVWLDVRYKNKNVAFKLYLRKKGFSEYFFIGSKSIQIWIQTSH